MPKPDGSVITKGGKPVSLPAKDYSYYRQIAQRLLPYAETENDDGESVYYFRTMNLNKVFQAIKVDPSHFGTMREKGFFKLKQTHPPGWYFYPEGDTEVQANYVYPTKKLRQIARRLYKNGDRDNSLEKEQRFMYKKQLEVFLNNLGHDPDVLIPQLLAKNYLVKRNRGNEPQSYFIFCHQKEGHAF